VYQYSKDEGECEGVPRNGLSGLTRKRVVMIKVMMAQSHKQGVDHLVSYVTPPLTTLTVSTPWSMFTKVGLETK
jgi:hypothetical protein